MNLDLFAGAGGWEAGGLNAVGLELDPTACSTRRAAGLLTIRADVSCYPVSVFFGKVEGLVASPPCQDWSRDGKRAKLASARGQLVWQPRRWVEWLHPRWVALEQVPDVLEVWQETAWWFGQLGYSTWTGILNAADYGVPQTRQRAILIASAERKVRPPEPTHSDQRRAGSLLGLAPWISMAEALGWVGNGVDDPARTIAGHRAPRWMYPGNVTTGRTVTLHTNRDQRPDGSRQVVDPAAGPGPAFTAKSGGQWVLRRERGQGFLERGGPRRDHPLDEPAPAITAGVAGSGPRLQWVQERPATTVQGDPRVGRPGHKHRENGEGQFDQQAVRITLEEALMLQGFPADYPVQGTKTKRFEQVGNAIPPPLATAIIGVAS